MEYFNSKFFLEKNYLQAIEICQKGGGEEICKSKGRVAFAGIHDRSVVKIYMYTHIYDVLLNDI